MRRFLFLITALVVMASTSSAFALLDDFEDGVADGWTPDVSLWSVGDEDEYGNLNQVYWNNAGLGETADDYKRHSEKNWDIDRVAGGTISVDFMRPFYGGEGENGILFAGDWNKSTNAWFAGLYYLNTYQQQWTVGINEFYWNAGMQQWRPTGPWHTVDLPGALNVDQWYHLDVNVLPSQATVTMDGTYSASMALSSIPTGEIGVYNSVGWSAFDNFETDGGGVIPEPTSIMLLGTGLLGFGVFARKKR